MKYKPEYYIDAGMYADDDVENHREKLVKCRKSHQCMGGCDSEIQIGDIALLETGFSDGKPVSCYTCLSCIEQWLEESGQVGFDEEDSNG